MTADEMGYNRKLVGRRGEIYKYAHCFFGAYVLTKPAAKKIAALPGVVRRQDGDYETTFSVPQGLFPELKKILGVSNLAVFERD